MNKRNAKGKPITNALADKLHDMRALLLALDRAELDAVASDLDGLSETNCSWMAYEHQSTLKQIVAEAISEQERVRRIHRARMGLDYER